MADEVDALRAARSATTRVATDRTGGAAATMEAALARLGLGGETPRAGSWADRLLVAVAEALPGRGLAVDPLRPGDDDAVIDALARLGPAYAAAPYVMGRRPETGPIARRATPGATATARDRLAARFAEIAAAAAAIRHGAAPADWIAAATLRPGTGFAAVEIAARAGCTSSPRWTRRGG